MTYAVAYYLLPEIPSVLPFLLPFTSFLGSYFIYRF